MEKLLIRKATLNDLGALRAFEQGVISTERPFDPTLKNDPVHYYDLEQMISAPHIELLVAEWDAEIIASGYARIEDAKRYLQHRQYAYLGFMYVVPAHRGKGVNKKIIDALASWSRQQNITELRLEVYQQNNAAINAYERAGFSRHMVTMRKGLS